MACIRAALKHLRIAFEPHKVCIRNRLPTSNVSAASKRTRAGLKRDRLTLAAPRCDTRDIRNSYRIIRVQRPSRRIESPDRIRQHHRVHESQRSSLRRTPYARGASAPRCPVKGPGHPGPEVGLRLHLSEIPTQGKAKPSHHTQLVGIQQRHHGSSARPNGQEIPISRTPRERSAISFVYSALHNDNTDAP